MAHRFHLGGTRSAISPPALRRASRSSLSSASRLALAWVRNGPKSVAPVFFAMGWWGFVGDKIGRGLAIIIPAIIGCFIARSISHLWSATRLSDRALSDRGMRHGECILLPLWH